jgi:MtN3 and saliva related transmembrane protein
MAADSQIVGYVAGALTTACVIPQLVRSMRTRSTSDISYAYVSLLCAGMALWITYGFLIEQIPVIVPNMVSLFLNLLLITIKFVFDRFPKTTISEKDNSNKRLSISENFKVYDNDTTVQIPIASYPSFQNLKS